MARRKNTASTGNQNDDDQSDDNQPDPVDDRSVMRGGPGDRDTSPTRTTEDLVEVTVGGKKFSVPKEVAEHYSQQPNYDERFQRIEQALSNLAQPTQKGPKQPSRTATGDDADDEFADVDIDTLLLSDPKAAAKLIKERAVKAATEQMRGEYTAEQRRQAFWTDFYASNQDLAKYKKLVNMVFSENFSEIGSMTPAQAAKKIAEYTRQEIINIRGDAPTSNRKADRTRSEPGTMSVPRASAGDDDPQDDGKITSLSALLRQRAEARRAGRKAS
jgi:hypothetical protein